MLWSPSSSPSWSPTNVSHAFQGFTDHPHLWWPLDQESVFGEGGSHVEFEENLILETAEDGRTSVWGGTIDDWQPPLSFHASWYPASTPPLVHRDPCIVQGRGRGH